MITLRTASRTDPRRIQEMKGSNREILACTSLSSLSLSLSLSLSCVCVSWLSFRSLSCSLSHCYNCCCCCCCCCHCCVVIARHLVAVLVPLCLSMILLTAHHPLVVSVVFFIIFIAICCSFITMPRLLDISLSPSILSASIHILSFPSLPPR